MPRRKAQRPTDGELEILQILWELGGRTISEISNELGQRVGTRPGAESIRKRLEIMMEKELVRRDDDRAPKIYHAAVAETPMKKSLLRDFMHRVFGGSRENLLMHALQDNSATPQELEDLAGRLKELRRRRGKR